MDKKDNNKPPLNSTEMHERLKGDTFPDKWDDFIDNDIRVFFDEQIELKGKKRSDVIRRANIPRTFGYQIMEGRRRGKRDYYLCLALAMSLDLRTTQRMMVMTGNAALYSMIKRDAAIIFAINKGYSLEKTYDFMVGLGEPPLDSGTGDKDE